MQNENDLKIAAKALTIAAKNIEKALQLLNPAKTPKPPPVNMGVSTTPVEVLTDIYYRALKSNKHKLKGRMTLSQVAEALNMEIPRGDRVAFSTAIKLHNITRAKSGSVRYYVFVD